MNIEHTTRLIEELKNTKNLDSYMLRHSFHLSSLSFTDYLDHKIKASGLKKAAIIRSIDLSRSYAYEIFSGFKSPSRDKVIMLSFGIGLDYDETQKLLIMAKHNPLYPKDKRDSIIMYAKYNTYSFVTTNLLLEEFNEQILI